MGERAEWEAASAAKAEFATICMPEHGLSPNMRRPDNAIEGVKIYTTQQQGMHCDVYDNKPDKKRKLDHVAGISDAGCTSQPTQPAIQFSSDIHVMGSSLHGDSKGLPDLNKDESLHLINQVRSTPLDNCAKDHLHPSIASAHTATTLEVDSAITKPRQRELCRVGTDKS